MDSTAAMSGLSVASVFDWRTLHLADWPRAGDSLRAGAGTLPVPVAARVRVDIFSLQAKDGEAASKAELLRVHANDLGAEFTATLATEARVSLGSPITGDVDDSDDDDVDPSASPAELSRMSATAGGVPWLQRGTLAAGGETSDFEKSAVGKFGHSAVTGARGVGSQRRFDEAGDGASRDASEVGDGDDGVGADNNVRSVGAPFPTFLRVTVGSFDADVTAEAAPLMIELAFKLQDELSKEIVDAVKEVTEEADRLAREDSALRVGASSGGGSVETGRGVRRAGRRHRRRPFPQPLSTPAQWGMARKRGAAPRTTKSGRRAASSSRGLRTWMRVVSRGAF